MKENIEDYFLEYGKSKKVEYAGTNATFSNKEALIFKEGVLNTCSTTIYEQIQRSNSEKRRARLRFIKREEKSSEKLHRSYQRH